MTHLYVWNDSFIRVIWLIQLWHVLFKNLAILLFHKTAVICSEIQRVAVCCSVMQCDAVCCSVLQCVAVCCSVLQCIYTRSCLIGIYTRGSSQPVAPVAPRCTATHCNTILRTATHCNTLQLSATPCNIWYHILTCCSTLQQEMSNVLQHVTICYRTHKYMHKYIYICICICIYTYLCICIRGIVFGSSTSSIYFWKFVLLRRTSPVTHCGLTATLCNTDMVSISGNLFLSNDAAGWSSVWWW